MGYIDPQDVIRYTGYVDRFLSGGPEASLINPLTQLKGRFQPRLFIGPLTTAQKLDLLRQHSIASVLDCSVHPRLSDGIPSATIPTAAPSLIDTNEIDRPLLVGSISSPSPVYRQLPKSSNGNGGKIDLRLAATELRLLATNGNVLVTCVSATNRSPAVCVAFFMLACGATLFDALSELRANLGACIYAGSLQQDLVQLAAELNCLGSEEMWKNALAQDEKLRHSLEQLPRWMEEWQSIDSEMLNKVEDSDDEMHNDLIDISGEINPRTAVTNRCTGTVDLIAPPGRDLLTKAEKRQAITTLQPQILR